MHRASAHCIRIGVGQGCRTRRGSSHVVLQVTDDDLQNPELLAEMQALMGGDPTPAPKPDALKSVPAPAPAPSPTPVPNDAALAKRAENIQVSIRTC